MMKDFIFSLSNLFTSDMVIPIWIKQVEASGPTNFVNLEKRKVLEKIL